MCRRAPTASAPGVALQTVAPTHPRAQPRTTRRKPGEGVCAGWSWGGKGTTTAAREEARKEAVLDMLRALVEDSRRGVRALVFVARWETPW